MSRTVTIQLKRSIATYAPPPERTQNTPPSFYAADIAALASSLLTNDFDAEPGRSPHQYARLWYCGSLVVVYNSGTTLVQGKSEPATARLTALIGGR